MRKSVSALKAQHGGNILMPSILCLGAQEQEDLMTRLLLALVISLLFWHDSCVVARTERRISMSYLDYRIMQALIGVVSTAAFLMFWLDSGTKRDRTQSRKAEKNDGERCNVRNLRSGSLLIEVHLVGIAMQMRRDYIYDITINTQNPVDTTMGSFPGGRRSHNWGICRSAARLRSVIYCSSQSGATAVPAKAGTEVKLRTCSHS